MVYVGSDLYRIGFAFSRYKRLKNTNEHSKQKSYRICVFTLQAPEKHKRTSKQKSINQLQRFAPVAV